MANLSGPNTQQAVDNAQRQIQLALASLISRDDPKRKSLLLVIYEALSVKPGAFGVSFDFKQLLEYLIPDIRAKLSKRPERPLTVLRPFVTASGARTMIPRPKAEEILGVDTFEALLASGFLTQLSRADSDYVELTHDMIAAAIPSA